MTDLTLESLAQRVERVEQESRRLARQNRRLKALAVIALAVAALVGGATAVALVKGEVHAPETVGLRNTIEANRFVVRDADGNERATLGVDDLAQAALALRDAQGRVLLALSTAKHGEPGVVIYDGTGLARAILGTRSDLTSLSMYDPDRRPRATLMVDSLGQPQFQLYDAKGDAMFSAP